MAAKPLSQFARLPQESSAAWHGFQIFRDLGPTRSLAETSRLLGLEHSGSGGLRIESVQRAPKERRKKANGRVSLWSRKYHWISRCEAWDHFVDARLREKQLSAIEKMAARHASQNEILMHGLMAPAQAFVRALQDPNRALALDAASLPELFKMMVLASSQTPRVQRAERLSRGVKLVDTEPLANPASTQSPAEWRITVHQPQRDSTTTPTLESNESQDPEEWEEAD